MIRRASAPSSALIATVQARFRACGILIGVGAFIVCVEATGTSTQEVETVPTSTSANANLKDDGRKGLVEGRPPLPGFRAAILDQREDPWPFALSTDASAEVRRAADMIGKRLAIDGLLLTTAQTIAIIGSRSFIDDEAESMMLLREAGLPIDWLAFFKPPDESASKNVVVFLATLMDAGRSAATLGPEIESCSFAFVPTRPGFQVAAEGGELPIDTVRLQLSRGSHWKCEGDGGNLDVSRHLITELPNAQFLLSVDRRFADDLQSAIAAWPEADGSRIRVVAEDLTLSQWAQDNGKPGFIHRNGVEAATAALIVPRFASRGEDGSTFVPGESFVVEGLVAVGVNVFQSPLLFQGGDLMAVRNPKTGERLLLVGEGQIYRNMALGLTESQVMAAMRAEFGVDRFIKLPAVSFHVDFEVSVRVHDGRLIAFVLDTPAAARQVIETIMLFMANAGMLEQERAVTAVEHLRANRIPQAVQIAADAIWRNADANGHFPLSFADQFSAGPADSGVGNLHRVLLALDLLVSESADIKSLGLDRHSESYLASLARRETDRKALRELLANEGFDVVPVPGLSDGDRGINPLNGLHEPGRYLMPAYGGMFSPVDAAAAAAITRLLGPNVQIVPILSSETQRRSGGVHCSASVWPRVHP